MKAGLAMPLFARRLFLSDLDAMCNFFVSPGISSNPADFKKHVPDALDAEGWFRPQPVRQRRADRGQHEATCEQQPLLPGARGRRCRRVLGLSDDAPLGVVILPLAT